MLIVGEVLHLVPPKRKVFVVRQRNKVLFLDAVSNATSHLLNFWLSTYLHLISSLYFHTMSKFSPIKLLKAFPYRCIDHDHADSVVDAFFDDTQFWAQKWHL
jgi:hypothetical protein